jgi:hypothetical protein
MLKEFTEKIHKKNIGRKLDKQQKEVNKLYAEPGLTDEVLTKQTEINRIRNKENITDKNQRIHKNFVQ